jgi:hypothetical protein
MGAQPFVECSRLHAPTATFGLCSAPSSHPNMTRTNLADQLTWQSQGTATQCSCFPPMPSKVPIPGFTVNDGTCSGSWDGRLPEPKSHDCGSPWVQRHISFESQRAPRIYRHSFTLGITLLPRIITPLRTIYISRPVVGV